MLVAYFTRTGNTRVIARQIRRALDADLFEIQPAEPYPEDYEETVAQATRERESGFESPLAALVEGVERYETRTRSGARLSGSQAGLAAFRSPDSRHNTNLRGRFAAHAKFIRSFRTPRGGLRPSCLWRPIRECSARGRLARAPVPPPLPPSRAALPSLRSYRRR